MSDETPRAELGPNPPRSNLMRLRLALYPYRRYLKWLREVARWQMRFRFDEARQWRFCRWVSLLTLDPGENVLWRMPGTSLNFSLELVETVQMSLFYRNAYQPEIMYWVKRSLHPDRIFVDAGAHVGVLTLIAAEYNRENWGPRAQPMVYAFEPNPHVFSQLERNVRLNGLEALVSSRQLAVSDREESTSFYLSRADSSYSSSLAWLGPGYQHTGEAVHVRTIALSTFIRSHAEGMRIGLIKLDVEGAELLALRGSLDLLAQDRPVLIVEVHPALMHAFGYTFHEECELLCSFGYELFRIQPDCTLVELDIREWPSGIQYGDMICFPHERDSGHASPFSGTTS